MRYLTDIGEGVSISTCHFSSPTWTGQTHSMHSFTLTVTVSMPWPWSIIHVVSCLHSLSQHHDMHSEGERVDFVPPGR